MITLESFVESDVVEKAYKYSGKSFLYELACQPMMHTTGVFVARHVRLQRHGEGVLDFADDEDAVEGADAVKIA